MHQITDTQLDCLADVVGHLIDLARKEKNAVAPMDSEAHSATASTEQTEATRQVDCTTPGPANARG